MSEGESKQHKVRMDTPEARAAFMERVAAFERSEVFKDWDALLDGEEKTILADLSSPSPDLAFYAGELKGIRTARTILRTWAETAKRNNAVHKER